MAEATSVAITRRLNEPFDRAVEDTRAALKAQGFGIVTELDMRKTLHDKIGVDFAPYVILGACDPRLAHRMLSEVPEVGVLLPCNVVVRQDGEGSVVSAFDPEMAMAALDSALVNDVACTAKDRLTAALDSLGGA